ncbi:MAG: ribonuclease R [Clostridia bacterium]
MRKNNQGTGPRQFKGTIQGTSRQFAFFIPEDREKNDVFIPPENLNGAMHGDNVLISLEDGRKRKEKVGRVIKIFDLERKEVTGGVKIQDGRPFLAPFDKRMEPILLTNYKDFNLDEDFMLVVRITGSPSKGRPANGEIIEVIGPKTSKGAYINLISRSYGFLTEYPEAVKEEARQVGATVMEDMPGKRTDYRKLRMVTIDGADAKDLDDAVSIEKLQNGNHMLGVHIADVSAFVGKGTLMDREARKRGTSVYLVDTVIPMLPEELSNGLCSLNPQVDRLALSVMMQVDGKGGVVDVKISESVIRTMERMTYDDVSAILEGNDPELIRKYSVLAGDFREMRDLALTLRKKRMDRGSMDFDLKDTMVILNTEGIPIDIRETQSGVANQIIEEFMILCNETVAAHFSMKNLPLIFRVHDRPDEQEIAELNKFVKTLGFEIRQHHDINPKSLQRLLNNVKGSRVEHLVNSVTLRTLKKAVYTPANIGHFGLASEMYCHFTSPIRRYPDLINHRMIKSYLKGNKAPEDLQEISLACSNAERLAEKAERDVIDYFKAVYTKNHIGDVFEGVVSGVTAFGMFVELDNTVEGLIRIENLNGYYSYDKSTYSLTEKQGKKRFTLGDAVTVKIVNANVDTREIDMMLMEKHEAGKR